MEHPHVIRLRPPWDREADEAAPPAKQRWRRRFGRPTGLSAGVCVRLVVQAGVPIDEVRMNGAALIGRVEAEGLASVEISAVMLARNTLEVQVAADSAVTSPTPDFVVWLEISET